MNRIVPRIVALMLALCGGSALAGDLPLQKVALRALGDRPGAVVAMDSRDGRLLAVVNPRVAAGSALPIGSLAKLVTGMAAVEAGVIDGARSFPCRGRFERWNCWRVHGTLALEEAIAHSCSSFFFAVGRELGAPRLNQAFRAAGFGRSTGSLLPGEVTGRFSPARTRSELTELAYGDTAALQATPLQVASWLGAIANGGTRYRPHLASESPRTIGTLASPRGMASLRAGMRRAVLQGSARGADVPGLTIHGKTGTSSHLRESNRRHGWFVGFAGNLALVVFIKEGSGYDDAAPVAREVFAAWSGSE